MGHLAHGGAVVALAEEEATGCLENRLPGALAAEYPRLGGDFTERTFVHGVHHTRDTDRRQPTTTEGVEKALVRSVKGYRRSSTLSTSPGE
jgi:hypothetical protein